MDELNIRRRIIAEPRDDSADITQACNSDKGMSDLKSQMLDLDAKILNATKVPVPDNLADRLVLRQSIEFQKKQKTKQRWYLAIAASIAFTVGVSFQFMGLNVTHNNIGEYALDHVYAEGKHLHDDSSFSTQDVNDKLASFGAALTKDLGKINFADYCYFGGFKSMHLVFQGENSPVTVFLLPNDTGLTNTPNFSDETFTGSALDFSPAQLIIVTDGAESNEQWKEKLTNSIQWQKA